MLFAAELAGIGKERAHFGRLKIVVEVSYHLDENHDLHVRSCV